MAIPRVKFHVEKICLGLSCDQVEVLRASDGTNTSELEGGGYRIEVWIRMEVGVGLPRVVYVCVCREACLVLQRFHCLWNGLSIL